MTEGKKTQKHEDTYTKKYKRMYPLHSVTQTQRDNNKFEL